MKRFTFILFILLIACFSCEKVVLDEEETKKQEQTDKGGSGNSSSDDKSSGKQSDGDKSDDDNGSDNGSDSKDDNSDKKDESQDGNEDDTDWPEVDTSDKDSHEEKGIEDGNTDNADTRDERHTVAYFLTEKHLDGGVWVVGYIVGACKNSVNNPENIELKQPFTIATSLLLADNPNETDVKKMITIQLLKGPIRDKFNLVSHPENLHRRAEFFGYREDYLKTKGIENPDSYGWAD